MELFAAHKQWATRPADERYQSLAALTEAVDARKKASHALDFKPASFSALELQHDFTNISFGHAQLTNWSFGQLASLVGAPARYLRELHPELVVENLKHGLKHRFEGPESDMQLLMGSDNDDAGQVVLRAVTSGKYSRVWDADVLAAINQHAGGFHQPLGYKDGEWGAEMAPSGLYASDRDVFCFLVKESDSIEAGGEVLKRGFYAFNSEVGGASFGWATFLYRECCGNNIIWGATQVDEVRVRHVGSKPQEALTEWFPAALDKLRNTKATALERDAIVDATKDDLAPNAEEAYEVLRKMGFAKSEAVGAVAAAEREEKNPFTRWGLLQGLTAHARTMTRLDNRVVLERRAAALLMPSVN